MFIHSRMRNIFSSSRDSIGIIKDSFTLLKGMLSYGSNPEKHLQRRAFQSLVYPMLQEDGNFSEHKKSVYRRLLEDQLERDEAEKHLAELDTLLPLPEAEALTILNAAGKNIGNQSIRFLLALAIALEESSERIEKICVLAEETGTPVENLKEHIQHLKEEHDRRKRLVRSSRGIIAALIIIVVFILTAKLLQSVIFGLLTACILLPLEKFFEKRIRNKRGIAFVIIALTKTVFSPLQKLSASIVRRDKDNTRNTESVQIIQNRAVIRQAVAVTAVTTFIFIAVLTWGISALTGKYMADVQKKVQLLEQKLDQPPADDTATVIGKINYYLDKSRDHFQKLPIVHTGLNFISRLINDPDVRTKFFETVLEHSGGIFSFTTGMVGKIISLLCDLLLTVFFALLFLIKMAEFCSDDGSDKRKSEYLVRSFFNGIWLPGTDENVFRETVRIIEGIFFRLRVWLKGYLTLILVDSTVYTTCFFFIGVPFFLPLGIIAGCGIALPYLGPVISCTLTVLVTLASGTASGNMLFAIVICYLIYNGVIEQFILYPAVIGESLGLSTLETIIVVLLGAIFAGIPGMILALPATSVAKYIIPQIYRGFIPQKN